MSSSGLTAIGECLKQYRKAKGLTQAEAASKVGIYRQNVSDIERGVFVGSIATLQKYLLFAGLEIACQALPSQFPQLDDLENLFEEGT
jgi:transcriptional regulator with XRE-family HTH domain